MPWSCNPNDVRILIVDDDPMLRKLLRTTLRSLDHTNILESESGQEAVELCQKNPLDLVFLDIEMPGEMNGIAVLNELRQDERPVSIIMITAHSTVANVRQAAASKVNGFLVKPLNPERIEKVLEHFHQSRCA
ncbi:MAG: response regulator [Lamprobacter sp.]|uniref:response regulator n=1 Tax=Lamprobacter sp. TaxID=3100796 RepID=UPI002B263838|nr:response regulator [Lamprobacter sp.]MEA3640327.1 response regulator [Lamprobacter sp.]